MTKEELTRSLEALIFASPQVVSARELATVLSVDIKQVEECLTELYRHYASRGIVLRKLAGGYQFATNPKLSAMVHELGRPVIVTPLSAAGLEVLAIIAYLQPITKTQMEDIRGVRSDSAIHTLLERELIVEVGRKEGLGRPILYGTTGKFLEHFGLDSLSSLPMKEVAPAKDESMGGLFSLA